MKKLILFLCCSLMAAQVAERANEGYRTPEGRRNVAASLSQPSRDARQKPRELVAALGIKPGMTIADLGSGTGYMLPYLSAAVGPEGKVYAEDIFPDFLDQAKKTSAAASLKNVEFVLGDEKQSKLPAGAFDLLFALDVYHHLNYPKEFLSDLRTRLKPSGRLVIFEYHKNKVSMPNGRALEHIRLTASDAIKEIEQNGFRKVSYRDFLPDVQWMGVFEPGS